jgi:hypothetical protein
MLVGGKIKRELATSWISKFQRNLDILTIEHYTATLVMA